MSSRRQLRFSLVIILLLGAVLLAIKNVSAMPILLEENFDDGNQLDGSPTYWEEIFNSNNWYIQNGKYVGTNFPGTGINSRTLTGQLSWDNYAVETTIKSITGVDRHILFRFDQNRQIPKGYAIKYRDAESGFEGHIELQKAGVAVVQTNLTFKSHIGESHRVRVEGIGNHIKVFVDGQKYLDYIDPEPILTGKIGMLIESSGSGLINTTEYDDVLVEQITVFSDELLSPSLIPSSTPEIILTPTPTPAYKILSVSDIKQYSSPWSDDMYDTASRWSNSPTIERWGCALTSASMILKYWGHNISPDNLNIWLNTQVDGYLGNGLLNWLAVTRYTKQHDSVATPTLEYRRFGPDLMYIINEIDAGRPAALKLPGHFVVGKGYSNGSYYINDPATTQNTLSYYGNSYLALNQFKPSHTDLSYILLTINPQFSIKVLNGNGDSVGEFFLEEPLIDDVNGIDTSDYLGIYLLPVPPDDVYTIQIAGPSGIYDLNSYIYNDDGDVQFKSFEGILYSEEKDIFQLRINGETTGLTQDININNILDDWNSAYSQGYIKNKNFYRSIKSLLLIAKKNINKKRLNLAKPVLITAKNEIVIFTPSFVDMKISKLIVQELDILINSI